MITIEISNFKTLHLAHVVTDVNGTLAVDGRLLEGVSPLIQQLRGQVEIHMLTADTHGRQAQIDEQLGFRAHIITRGAQEKADYVRELGAESVVAIGNGANDVLMCQAAALSIAVLGPEGAAGLLLQVADVMVRDVQDGLALLLNPQRLRATLRG